MQILDPDLNQKLEGEEGQGLSDLAGANEGVEGGESSIHKDSESQYRRSRRDMYDFNRISPRKVLWDISYKTSNFGLFNQKS